MKDLTLNLAIDALKEVRASSHYRSKFEKIEKDEPQFKAVLLEARERERAAIKTAKSAVKAWLCGK
jgi:hypothetical protein